MRQRTRQRKRVAQALLGGSVFLTHAAAAETTSEQPELGQSRFAYWNQGRARPFGAARMEAGLYLKPQIAVGYGEPYWINTTAETYGISTTSFGAGYGGIRGTLPFLELRVGARYTYSYYRSFLPPKEHYVSEDVSKPSGPLARYLSVEAELFGTFPLLGGYAFPVFTVYHIAGTPEGAYLFDESLRGVLKPPWIAGVRLGYVKSFGSDEFFKAGVLTEVVLLPGRSASVVRVGPAALVTLTDHLDAQGTITFVVQSPDSLGIWNGPFGVLGFVYRWATGDARAAFP